MIFPLTFCEITDNRAETIRLLDIRTAYLIYLSGTMESQKRQGYSARAALPLFALKTIRKPRIIRPLYNQFALHLRWSLAKFPCQQKRQNLHPLPSMSFYISLRYRHLFLDTNCKIFLIYLNASGCPQRLSACWTGAPFESKRCAARDIGSEPHLYLQERRLCNEAAQFRL